MLVRLAVALLMACPLATSVAAQRFDFGVIGDVPYTAAEEAQVGPMLADMDRRELAFIIHVGDLQAGPRSWRDGARPCADATLQARHAMFDAARHPARLVLLDTGSGAAMANLATCGDADDMISITNVIISTSVAAREPLMCCSGRRLRIEQDQDGIGCPDFAVRARTGPAFRRRTRRLARIKCGNRRLSAGAMIARMGPGEAVLHGPDLGPVEASR